MSKQVNYNENLCAGAAIRDDKGRRISKLFEASHPKMTVGYAKNLIMPDTPTEQEFNFRQAGGGVIEDGVAVIDKVKGNSVVWNQLWQKKWVPTATQSGITLTNNGDGSYTANGTANGDIDFYDFIIPVIGGHKYLLKGCPQGGGTNTYSFRLSGIGYDYGEGVIGTNSQTNNTAYEFHFTNGVTCSNLVFRPQIIDLTQMFGAGNEPTTYEEFLSRKPKVADEYAYNEGTIVNNKVEKVKTTGVNLWDEEWESGSYDIKTGEKVFNSNYTRSKNFTRVIPSSSIYLRTTITIGAIYILFYDREQKYLSYITGSNRIINIPGNCCYINIVWLNSEYGSTTYNHDICINLSDPSINGQYFPYEEHTLDLSWVKEIKNGEGVKLFEDGMKSAGTAFDEVAKGRAIKRIRKYVFDGSEPISGIELNDDGTAFKVSYLTLFETTTTGTHNAVSIGAGFYSQYNGGYYFDLWAAGFATVRSYIICVPSSVAKTSDEIKEYLKQKYDEGNPLVVYYELSEPIEVEYDEKNLTYPVIAGGTEEAIASEPSSAFRADIGYGIDAVKTILDLKARVEALEGK